MSDDDIKYGCINESYFSLRSPRMIDGDEHNSLSGAFADAMEMIENGADEVSIVRCKYSEKREVWVELVDGGSIQIQAHNWKDEDEFLAERKARREAKALAKQIKAAEKSQSK